MDGLDMKAIGDWIAGNGSTLAVTLLLVLGLGYLLTSSMAKRLGRLIEQTMFSNWRLALLAATGLILSLASGWTTWDGMRNFTGEPLLSLMITFGIQGVMLIVAWLIGESFATGMNQRGVQGSIGVWGMLVAMLGAIVLVGGLTALAVMDMTFIRTEHLVFAAVFIGIVAIIAAMQSDIVQPYLQSSRVILKNLVLWVMFLSCMATSVFFSFDSLFSTIFPAEERVRAAELRAQNQVAGIVADIGQTITTRRLAEAEQLFGTEGWRAYDEQLAKLSRASQGAQPQIEAYFVEQMEARRRAIAEQQERIATAQGSKAGLQARKIQLTEELSRLTADRPAAVNEKQQQQAVVSEIERRLDEKRALTLAEERGVEGSGKVGRGKFWREAKAAEQKVKYELEVAKRRLRSPSDRLRAIDKRIALIKGELSQIEGALAQLEGEAATAQQRISAAERATTADAEQLKVDPARVLPAFERAKTAFRQDPTQPRLSHLHQQCAQLVSAMASTPATKERVRGIDCDPKAASEAASTVFALNSGAQAFAAGCAGGSKLEANKSADALFGFARKCLADSGLPSGATDQLRAKINHAELNRDDKAHRFVVTWNAFQDGNRLAYLALGIAIAIDALVFMSGLFGANAVRSPLSDVPSLKARSAVQLESIVENALLPNTFDNAHAVLEAMQPITPIDGFTQEVLIPYEETPSRGRVLKVLNAAATIGAVHRDENRPERYLVRPELFEFLSSVAKRAFEEDKDNIKNAELRQVVTVALQPHVGDNADLVLAHMHPINERHGFSSEVRLAEIAENEIPIVRKTLNAGATLKFVQQDEKELDRFYIHKQLYKTLALISANYPKYSDGAPQIASAQPGARHGGNLGESHSQIAPPAAAIEDHTMRAPPPAAGTDAHEPQASAASESGHTEFRDFVLDHFASELGMQTEQLDEIVALSVDLDVKGLKQSLEAVIAHDPNMQEPIVRAYQAHDESISNALDRFEHPGLGDNRNLHMLNEFAAHLRALRPMLLLLPGSAYNNLLQRMWKELASDAERNVLDDVQERKLTLVQQHMQELAGASIVDKQGWDDVHQSLLRFSSSLKQLAGSA